MATVKTQQVREERLREKYKDAGSSTGGMSKTNINGMYEIENHMSNRSTPTMRSTHKSEKTGVDAAHKKLPTAVSNIKKCSLKNDGQKDALLRRANIIIGFTRCFLYRSPGRIYCKEEGQCLTLAVSLRTSFLI